MPGKRIVTAWWLAILLLALVGTAACNKQKDVKRFSLQGEVVSVDAGSKVVFVKHGDIPGFMSAMTMGYTVTDPAVLSKLSAGDTIQADLVVEDGSGRLENVRILKKADVAPTTTASPH